MRWVVLLVLSGCLFPSLDDLGGADGSLPDVVTNDASDAKSDADASSGPFCPQSNTVLCADFDEPDGNFKPTWDYVNAPGTSTIQESTAFSTSAPRSLLVATTGTDQGALVEKTVGFTNGLTLEFDLRIGAPRGGNTSVADFNMGAGSLALEPKDTVTAISEAMTLADGGTAYDGTSNNTSIVPTDTWVHVVYDWDRAAKSLTVKVDGNLVITYTPKNSAWDNTTSVNVYVGVGSSASETIYYDDVTIRTR